MEILRFALTLFIVVLSFVAPTTGGEKEPKPDLSGVIRLVGKYSVAHACPIEPTVALTCGHVVELWRDGRDVEYLPYVWSAVGSSEAGLTYATESARFRDLATITPQGAPFPRWYPVAADAPQPGDRVSYLAYSWQNKKRAFQESRVDTRVVRTVSGHVVTEDGGPGGSSGSCLVNERNEVVAVNCQAYLVNSDRDEVGFSIAVYGPWLDPTKATAAK